MKKLLFTVFLLALSLPSVGQTVQSRAVYTNQPVFTTTSPLPIQFQGWTATGAVSKMLVYVDYALVYTGTTSTLNTSLTLVPGQHVITVQFWDGQTWTKSQWTVGIVAAEAMLNWDPSTSTDVVGYNLYRSTVSGGYYAKVNSQLVAGTTFMDTQLQHGQTYYYVATAVDGQGIESIYSNEAEAIVP